MKRTTLPASGDRTSDTQKGNAHKVRQPMDLSGAKVPTGQVYVIPERCKECGFCVSFCPEKILTLSDATNAKGYHYPAIIEGKEGDCVHCGFCDLICPELAIFTKEISTPAIRPEDTANDSEC